MAIEQPLDPEAQAIVEVIGAANRPRIPTMSVDAARDQMRNALVSKRAPLPLLEVQDRVLPAPGRSLNVRLYRPRDGRLPLALFLHGGGWTVNDLDTHDELCRRLSKRSGWLIASLDFRRAPEHKHPAPLEDAYLAYRWLLDNSENIKCDPQYRALIGESSGGTTAATLSLLLRDLGAPLPTFQVIAYPVADGYDRWPSYKQRGTGYILDGELMRWYLDQYLPPGSSPADPYLFPLAAQELSGLPPTLMLTAEYDPLRDEGLAYTKRLAQAGVAVEHIHAADQMHGFLLLGGVVTKAAELVARVGDVLASVYAEGPARGAQPPANRDPLGRS